MERDIDQRTDPGAELRRQVVREGTVEAEQGPVDADRDRTGQRLDRRTGLRLDERVGRAT